MCVDLEKRRRIGTRCPVKGQCQQARRFQAAAVGRNRLHAPGISALSSPPFIFYQEPEMSKTDLLPLLPRVADALERLAPPAPPKNDLNAADAFIWHAEGEWLE